MARDPQIKIIVRGLGNLTAKKTKQLVLNVTANLTQTTPRDTSWARNNWIPEIGPGPSVPEGDRENVGAAAAAQAQAVAVIATSYKFGMGIITVTNNVPYIIPLNEGHSKQKPAGFVQAEIFRAVQQAGI